MCNVDEWNDISWSEKNKMESKRRKVGCGMLPVDESVIYLRYGILVS